MKNEKDILIQRSIIRSGLLIALGFIVYFFLMKYFGLIQYAELRAFNFVILLAGLFFTYRDYRLKTEPNIEYFSGLILGFLTSVISVVSFAIFVYIYFSSIDPVLLAEIKKNSPFIGTNLNPVTATISIIAEGISSGLIMSFSFMQYYKSGCERTDKKIKIKRWKFNRSA